MECINNSVDCDQAESWSKCPNCGSTLCEFCVKDSDFCINFGDGCFHEYKNRCQTCNKRICNNCARMCWVCEKDNIVECRECAQDKYVEAKCHKWVWLCKDKDHYCPMCRYWENAFGKMGY